MSEIDELRARAEELGVKVDGRWRAPKLTRAIAEAEAGLSDERAAEPEDDGWPQRIAPCAWLDQDGVCHHDMGLAYEAAQRIRERG